MVELSSGLSLKEIKNKGNVYLNGCSILFGSSGYLWVLLEFYKKITSNNPSRELIIDKIRDIYKDLISSYQKLKYLTLL